MTCWPTGVFRPFRAKFVDDANDQLMTLRAHLIPIWLWLVIKCCCRMMAFKELFNAHLDGFNHTEQNAVGMEAITC